MTPHPITLTADRYSVEVDARSGGQIARARYHAASGADLDLIKPRHAQAGRPATGLRPLAPYGGLLAHGQFSFQGETVHLSDAEDPQTATEDGLVFQDLWTVMEQTDTSVALVLDYGPVGPGSGWPWPFRASQRIVVSETGVTVSLGMQNKSHRPMPAGLGLKAFLPKSASARLAAQLGYVWTCDEAGLPIKVRDLSDTIGDGGWWNTIDRVHHCFGDWDGRVEIAVQDRDLAVQLEAGTSLGRLYLEIPPGEGHITAAALSHVPDAFNLHARGVGGTGFQALAPGKVLSGSLRLGVRDRS